MKNFCIQMLVFMGVVVGNQSSWATSIIPANFHQLPVGSVWESDYIPGKGAYILRVESESELAVGHDVNACGFDRLGNLGICTMMAPVFDQGEAFYESVPTNKNTLVVGIKGTKYNIVYHFSSLVSGTPDPRLLVLNAQNEVIYSVRLFERH